MNSVSDLITGLFTIILLVLLAWLMLSFLNSAETYSNDILTLQEQIEEQIEEQIVTALPIETPLPTATTAPTPTPEPTATPVPTFPPVVNYITETTVVHESAKVSYVVPCCMVIIGVFLAIIYKLWTDKRKTELAYKKAIMNAELKTFGSTEVEELKEKYNQE